MTSINLYQPGNQNLEKKTPVKLISGGVWAGIVVIALALLGWGSTSLYISYLGKQSVRLDAEILAANNGISTNTKLPELVDFEMRDQEVANNLKNKIYFQARAAMLEQLIGEGVVLESIEYKGDKLTASAVVNSYQNASKQIYAFKTSKQLKKFELKALERSNNNIKMQLELSFKDEAVK